MKICSHWKPYFNFEYCNMLENMCSCAGLFEKCLRKSCFDGIEKDEEPQEQEPQEVA